MSGRCTKRSLPSERVWRITAQSIRERFTLALHDTAVEAPAGEALGVD